MKDKLEKLIAKMLVAIVLALAAVVKYFRRVTK